MRRASTTCSCGRSPGATPAPAFSILAVSVRQHEAQCRVELALLDRLRRVDALGAHDRTLADEAALPHALGIADHRQALLESLVSRVEVVAARERDRGGAPALLAGAIHGARRVTQHAVDALAELAELVDLSVRLFVLAGSQRNLLLADNPRL